MVSALLMHVVWMCYKSACSRLIKFFLDASHVGCMYVVACTYTRSVFVCFY